VIRFARLSGSSCKLSSALQKENQRVMYWYLSIFCSTFRMRRAVVKSRPKVGSSRYRREGSIRISYPMLVRFLSPPETPLTNVPPIIVFLHLRREPKDARKHTRIHMNNSCIQQQKKHNPFLLLLLL
jgi:hypothetical protein